MPLGSGRGIGFEIDPEVSRSRFAAISAGYSGEACPECSRFTLKWDVGSLTCQTCGWTPPEEDETADELDEF